jgi:hypothetical protein
MKILMTGLDRHSILILMADVTPEVKSQANDAPPME